MSLIGLLTATEKQVHLGRLHVRPIQWHLKNNWRVPEKVIPILKSLHGHLTWWLEEGNVLQSQPLHPQKHVLQIFTDTSKRRVVRSLKRAHCKRNLVPARKQAAYKFFGTKGSLFSTETVPRPLLGQSGTCSNRQHHSDLIHKQGRRHEVGPTVCPTLESLDLVCQEASDSQSPTHPRPAEHGSREAIKARPDHPNRVVLPEVF